MNDNQALAMCGCRCDLCKAYAPNVEKDDRRKTLAAMWHKYYGLDPSFMDACGGCRHNPSDEGCPVRKCVLEKKLNHCGDCGQFPCGVFYQRCGSFPDEKKKSFDMDEYNAYILAYDNETRLKEYRTLKKLGDETMRFMRGKYALDEVGNGKDEVAFCDGNQKILTIFIRDGYYDFQIGQKRIKVSDMASLDNAKRLILARMEPSRKPFPKEQAIYSDCGHRCDLCLHYDAGTVSEEFRMELLERVNRVYGSDKPLEEARKTLKLCKGCNKPGFGEGCHQRECAAKKGVGRCLDCPEYHCGKATAGYKNGIEPRSISADDVTWAILPYVDGQYGN